MIVTLAKCSQDEPSRQISEKERAQRFNFVRRLPKTFNKDVHLMLDNFEMSVPINSKAPRREEEDSALHLFGGSHWYPGQDLVMFMSRNSKERMPG